MVFFANAVSDTINQNIDWKLLRDVGIWNEYFDQLIREPD